MRVRTYLVWHVAWMSTMVEHMSGIQERYLSWKYLNWRGERCKEIKSFSYMKKAKSLERPSQFVLSQEVAASRDEKRKCGIPLGRKTARKGEASPFTNLWYTTIYKFPLGTQKLALTWEPAALLGVVGGRGGWTKVEGEEILEQAHDAECCWDRGPAALWNLHLRWE